MDTKGEKNPNYSHGKYANGHYCEVCGCKIDPRSIRCNTCRSILDNPFKNRTHSIKTKRIIGAKSKAKFTKEYLDKIKAKYLGNKKRDINGYILIKDYNHPNKNSHNDVLEHIAIMSSILGRPLRKGEIVHHINFIRNDNRRSNLWLYKNISDHNKCSRSIFKLVDILIKTKIITFNQGEYTMNKRLLKGVSQVQFGGEV